MKIKSLLISLIILFCINSVNATIMQGGVSENNFNKRHQVIDKTTHTPIANAKINIPQSAYSTYTDSNGHFSMPSAIAPNTILSVEKQNYKPFSITITQKNLGKTLNLSIEKASKFDIVIDTSIYHIGDNNYSMSSANAYQFRSRSVGPVYKKMFFMPASSMTKQNYLVIGSIIGIDTAMARGMGQNNITTAFSSPPSIYLNGKKIAEIHINGDRQKIKLPTNLIKSGQKNELKIVAGINLLQTAYIDYDDIEFMNLNIE